MVYVGSKMVAPGHVKGYAWGTSNWTASSPGAPNVSGSLNLAQPIDIFAESGSFFAGLQARVILNQFETTEVSFERPAEPEIEKVRANEIKDSSGKPLYVPCPVAQ